MTLRTSLLHAVDAARALRGTLGLATTGVTVRTRTWTGGYVGADGGYSDCDLVLAQQYRVRELGEREVKASGGRYQSGDLSIGPITPSNGAGVGYTPAQLSPVVTANGIEVLYVLSGAEPFECTFVSLDTARPFRTHLVVRRRNSTPGP